MEVSKDDVDVATLEGAPAIYDVAVRDVPVVGDTEHLLDD
jgi:hypothetical protein